MRLENIIELSHRMIPGQEPFKLEAHVSDVTDILPEVKHRPDIWYVIGEVTFCTHSGTHIEFPYHHWKEGLGPADFPLRNLIGEAVVLDFSFKANGEAITLTELKPHLGRLKHGDIIFVRTDKDQLYRTERWNEQPYLTTEALECLLSFEPKVIGTDAGGFEVPGTDYQPNHLTMFKRGIPMVESATNLAAIGEDRVVVFILPLRIEGPEAMPVRIIAFRKGDLLDE